MSLLSLISRSPSNEDPTLVHSEITRVWNSHDDEAHRKSQSHWRGVGRWADDEKWQRIGKLNLQRVDLIYRILGRPPHQAPTVLEWGPGGGSIAFAFRDRAARYIGVDISAKNLAECSRVMAEAGQAETFVPVLLTGSPYTLAVTGPIDIFISNAVFQRFPSPAYGAEVLRTVRSLSNAGTIGVIQTRFDNGTKRYRGIRSLSQYYKRHITATSYAIDAFWQLLDACGWTPLAISKLKCDNREAYYLVAAKS